MNKSYWKYYITQILFLSFILLGIAFVYIFQRYTWADIYSTSWYKDASDWNLRNVESIYFIHTILLWLTISLPFLSIIYKKYKYIWLSVVTSLISIFFLSWALWFNWFWNCQDFCGFFTAFITPILTITIWLISTLILYILKRK